MGKKRRMLSSAKYKGKRTALWEALNNTAELSARVDEVIEQVEAVATPVVATPAKTFEPAPAPIAKPVVTKTIKTAKVAKTKATAAKPKRKTRTTTKK